MKLRSHTNEQTHAIVVPPRSTNVMAEGTAGYCVAWVDAQRQIGAVKPFELLTVVSLAKRRSRAVAKRQARDRANARRLERRAKKKRPSKASKRKAG